MASQKLQCYRAANVSPSDTSDIPSVMNGENNGCILYIGGTGNVRVLTPGGDDVTYFNVQGGTYLATQVVRVFSTDTTATAIVANW